MSKLEDIRRRAAEGYDDDGIQAQYDVSVLLNMLDRVTSEALPETSIVRSAHMAALSALESAAEAARDETSRLQAWMYAIEGGDNPILDDAELRLMANYAIRGDAAP